MWIRYSFAASGRKLLDEAGFTVAPSSPSAISPSAVSDELTPGGGAILWGDHVTQSRRYTGPFELKGDTLIRINASGGFWQNGQWNSYVTDRQGNVRAVLRDNGATAQRIDYYPYGLPLADTNPTANAYRFSAKELETRYALNFSHHGARLYFPDLGRFATPDPLAGNTPGTSTYLFCAANPANFIDPTGLIFENEKLYNSLSNAVATRLESLNTDISKIEQKMINLDPESKKHKSLVKKKDSLSEQKRLLDDISQVITDMNNDPNHIFSFGAGLPGKGHTVKRNKSLDKDGAIGVTIFGENNSVYIHEIKHIGQSYADEGLQFDKKSGGLKYARNGATSESYAENVALMEEESYRTQFAFDNNEFKKIMPNVRDISEIDKVSIGNIISPYTNNLAYPLIYRLVHQQVSK